MKNLVMNKAMLVGMVSLIGSVSAVVLSNGHTPNSDTQVKVVNQQTQEKSYILQGLSLTSLISVVEQAGGIVSREFPIINAISALLTSEQVSIIAANSALTLMEDRTVRTESVSKKFIIDNYIATQTNANAAHDWGITGQGVTIAVLDSGMNLNGTKGAHIRYDQWGNERILAIYDTLKSRMSTTLTHDKYGHGSHVAGVIASSYKDENGNFNGIAPNANLISIRAFDKNGQGTYSDTLDGLNWIYDNKDQYNIRVLNLSLGAEVQSNYWNDPKKKKTRGKAKHIIK